MRVLHLAVGLLLLTSCRSSGVSGDGTTKTETRDVGPFTRVDASTALEVTVTHGPLGPLSVTTDTNLLPLLETEATGGTLHVHFKETNVHPTVAKILVATPHLVGASGAGAAHVTAEGIDEEAITVEASSGAEVHVAGKAKSLDARASSGALVDAADLAVSDAKVQASSGAKLYLGNVETVSGAASSGAKVTYKGEPKRHDVATSSGASVERAK